MINCEKFDAVCARWSAYWHRENHDRPLMDITAPAAVRMVLPAFRGTLKERWLDTEYMLKSVRVQMRNTYYAGEAYPFAYPNLGPDIFGAYFGCNLEFGENTSWATGHVDDLNKLDLSRLNEDSFWWRKTAEMTEAMAVDARGDYVAGITDLHPGMDALVSLRGPQGLCFDLYEEGELVKKLTMQLFDRLCEVYARLRGILDRYQTGTTNWMGVYHPVDWYVTSCDLMGMISGDMMVEFVEPELKQELSFFGHSIFHLDGPGALRHLDRLLALDTLDGVQWVYGAGQPAAARWINVLKRIQDAGKLIHVDIVPEDLPLLLEALRPEGVLYRVHCASTEEADALLRTAERARGKTIY